MGYPLEEKWKRLAAEIAESPIPQPTGFTREVYLDIAERIVRAAVPWQDEAGTIIDPYRGIETNSCTARFVGSLGQLIGAGRCLDLLPVCIKSYEACLLRLDEVKTYPEFWTKELMYAHAAMKDKVPQAQLSRWEEAWRQHDPYACYGCVVQKMEHNFVVFALAGEFFKGLNGFGGYTELIDDLLETQRKHFTPYGLYRDPNDPITYDLVVRQQLDLIRSYGYSGRNLDWLKEVSRRGALTALLYQSSTGQAPFGGRSNQFHFVEAHFACMCESQARFYKEAGDMVMAEVFKRAGRRAVALTLPWIMDMEPFHHTKQGFHPSLEHGVDSGGFYSIYGILMASLCGTAYHLADENIGERITPAELGGYVFELWPAHHKVFATCGGYHAEIDTRADLQKDSTGLGRIHRRGVWPETALSASISSGASYTFGVDRPLRNLALGPAWKDADGKEHRLADFGAEIENVTLSIGKETQEEVSFEVRYSGKMGSCREIVESYCITSGGIDYSFRLDPEMPEQRILVPVILSDGEKEAAVSETDTGLNVTYRGAEYRIRIRVGKHRRITDDPPSANRNAFYRTLEIRDDRVSLELMPPD